MKYRNLRPQKRRKNYNQPGIESVACILLEVLIGAMIVGGIFYIGKGLFKWYDDSKSDRSYKKISSAIEEDIESNEDTDYTPPEELLNLMEENPDVVGYLIINGTKISYPIAKAPEGEADDYYLHLNLKKTYSYAGTIFLEQNQDIIEGNLHSIFGHNMKNGTMFGTLPEYAVPAYLEEHKEGTIYTKTEEIDIEAVGFYEATEKPEFLQNIPSKARAGFVLSDALGAEIEEGNYYVLTTCMYREENDRGFLVMKRTN